MIALVAVTGLATLAGLLWHARDRASARRGAARALDANLWLVAPFVAIFTLPHLQVADGAALGIALAWATQLTVAACAWLVARRLLGLERHCAAAVVVCVIVVNAGFFGYPVVKQLLGDDALPSAIAIDAAVTGPCFYVVAMLVGAAAGTRCAGGRWRAVLRNPLPWATALGLLLPVSASPPPLHHAASDAVWLLPALGFLALGVFLADEAREGPFTFPPRIDAPVALAIGLRLLVAPLLFLALTAAAGGAPTAYRLEMAMPSGTSSLLVAHAFGLDLRIVSSALVWTAMLALAAALAVSVL